MIINIQEVLSYDPETGDLTWKVTRRKSVAGNLAGCSCPSGYRRVVVNGVKYLCHRIAWYLYYGAMPEETLDHINGIKNDNRIVNLRLASQQQNNYNIGARPHSSSQYKGVSWTKQNSKWAARITKKNKKQHLGYYATEEEAAKAYNAAAIDLFGEYARLNIIDE